jgi:hypothetical protein
METANARALKRATSTSIDQMEESDAAKADADTVKLFCKIMKKAQEASQSAT